MPTARQFQAELRRMLQEASLENRPSVEIRAGDLHERVGDYPDSQRHRMPTCCSVMRQTMQDGDRIVSEPPKGNGASLTIMYQLPRR
jgi:hypothetical protein